MIGSAPSKMKLLMLSTITSERDGLRSRPYYMAKYLREMPVELRLVVFDAQLSGFLPQELIVLPSSYHVKFKDLPSIYLLSRFLRHLIDRQDPDLIYAHEPTNILTAALAKAGTGLRLPIAGDMHGLASIEMSAWGNPATAPIFTAIERCCAQVSSGLIVASQDIKEELAKRYSSATRIDIVRNCVDTSEFFPIPDKLGLRKKLELPETKRIVVFTAPRTFAPNVLAIRLLYRVAMILERRSTDILLLILGGGRIPSDPQPPNVRYTGRVSNINDYLNACDLAVAPYPNNAVCGGLRNKVLEYWACGLAVVSTVEGLRGLLGSGRQIPAIVVGYDPESIATTIEHVAHDASFAKELGEKARALVLAEYRWDLEARKLHGILERFSSRG